MTKKRRNLTNDELAEIASLTSEILSLNLERELSKALNTINLQKLIRMLINASSDQGDADGRSKDSLNGLIMRLMHLGKKAFMYCDTGIPAINANGCVIIVSKGGDYTAKIITINKIGAKIILITADDESPTAVEVKKNKRNMVIKICGEEAIQDLNAYFYKKYHKRITVTEYAPLGTLFETATYYFLNCVVAMAKEELGKTEADMKKKHKSF